MHVLVQCCGSGILIPDPWSEFFPSRILDPGLKRFRIRIKEFKLFLTHKVCLQALGYMIWDVHPGSGSWFFTIPDPGFKNGQGPGSATLFSYFLVRVWFFFYNRIRPFVSFRFRMLLCTGSELGYESKRRKRKDTGRLHFWAVWYGIEPSVNCTSGDMSWHLWIAPQVTFELTPVNCTSDELGAQVERVEDALVQADVNC